MAFVDTESPETTQGEEAKSSRQANRAKVRYVLPAVGGGALFCVSCILVNQLFPTANAAETPTPLIPTPTEGGLKQVDFNTQVIGYNGDPLSNSQEIALETQNAINNLTNSLLNGTATRFDIQTQGEQISVTQQSGALKAEDFVISPDQPTLKKETADIKQLYSEKGLAGSLVNVATRGEQGVNVSTYYISPEGKVVTELIPRSFFSQDGKEIVGTNYFGVLNIDRSTFSSLAGKPEVQQQLEKIYQSVYEAQIADQAGPAFPKTLVEFFAQTEDPNAKVPLLLPFVQTVGTPGEAEIIQQVFNPEEFVTDSLPNKDNSDGFFNTNKFGPSLKTQGSLVTNLAFSILTDSEKAAASATPLATATPEIQPTAKVTESSQTEQTPEQKFSSFKTSFEAVQAVTQFSRVISRESGKTIAKEQILSGITFESQKDAKGNVITNKAIFDNTILFHTDREGNWVVSTPGSYWAMQGKSVGLYLNNEENLNWQNQNLLTKHFSGGTLSLLEQVRPDAKTGERLPAEAADLASEAKENHMNLFFHYVLEPGRFPKGINTGNVDAWLDARIGGVAELAVNNKTPGKPMRISLNEAWEGNVWNKEANPLRDKYGEKWLNEYTYRLLSICISKGLIPGVDFEIIFNEGNMFDRPAKQTIVHDALVTARAEAFNRLIADPTMANKLRTMNINKPEDIKMILGAEMHVLLHNVKDKRQGVFFATPTDEQITALSLAFEDLGGVIGTEVNPNGGTPAEQSQFLARLSHLMNNNSGLRELILWNVFRDSDDNRFKQLLNGEEEAMWGLDGLELFAPDGTPTSQYYSLLTN